MDPFDNLAQSIHIFNHICEQTQIINIDLDAQTMNDYVNIVNNVVRSLHQAAPAEHSYIMLYTDSLFDALDTLRYYLHHVPRANTADFIGNQGFRMVFATTDTIDLRRQCIGVKQDFLKLELMDLYIRRLM